MSHQTVRFVLAAGLLVAGGLLLPAATLAQPQIPATYFGTATINGLNVPDGTPVRAFIAGMDCTQPAAKGTVTDGGVSSYVIVVMHESQAQGCGETGSPVSFMIGDEPAVQTTEWMAGVQQVNLNAGTGSPIPLPTSTEPPTLDPEAATAAALRTPETAGSPPTDDPDVAAPTIGEAAVIDDEESSSLIAWVAIVLGVLALGGAVGGWALSRKRA